MDARSAHKTFRRLIAAEGYLQLGMPAHALLEIDAIEDAGPLAPPMHYMRGEALRAQERYEDAIPSLRLAAQTIPAPHNKQAWLALGDCLRHRGQTELAEIVETIANARPHLQVVPAMQINITLRPPSE